MIHLFKHSKGKLKGKYDIVLMVKGKMIVFSNQGYSRKKSAIKAIISVMFLMNNKDNILVQDDSLLTPSVFRLFFDESKVPTMYLTHKPYHP